VATLALSTDVLGLLSAVHRFREVCRFGRAVL